MLGSVGRLLAAEPQNLLYRTSSEMGALDPALPQRLRDVTGVYELEKLAERILPSGHFGYIYSGAGKGESKQANRDAYEKHDIQPRRLQALGEIDTSVELFGKKWKSPIFMSPTNGHRAFHPEGELGTAKGARQADALMMLSSLTNTPVEEVNQARGEPVFYQLYPTNDEGVRFEIVARAEAAGCPAIVITVDDLGVRRSEISAPYFRKDTRNCSICHQRQERGDFLKRKPMLSEYRLREGFNIVEHSIRFESIKRLRDQVKGKLIVKGIMHPDDALSCLEAGADGIVVSNHGGRVESGGLGTLDALPAIAQAVKGKMTIMLDGGIRRGTDAFKALALGADAVGFGRPYLWGLVSYGSEGVAYTLDLVTAELRQAMLQAGAQSVSEISSNSLIRN